MRKILTLIAFFLIIPTSAHAQWFRADSDHFVVYAERSQEDTQTFAEELERFDKGVRRLRGLPAGEPGVNRVTVYLMRSSLFRDITSSRSIGGFYHSASNGSVAFLPTTGTGISPQQTLFHEYTHHLFSVAWSNIAIPGWLSEGMAELHATAEVRSDGSMVFGREPSYRTGSLRNLDNDQITAMLTANTEESGVYIYYTAGWLLTHYLTFDPERDGQLSNYIVAINSGQSLEEAAETAFGDTRKFESDLARYRRGTSLPAVAVPAEDIQIGDVTVRPLTPGERATIEWAIRSRSGVDEEEAEEVYAALKPLAETYSGDALAQRAFAEAAFDKGAFDDVIVAADRAIAADPSLGSVYAYKARAMMEAPESYADIDDATWIDIRRVIVAGLQADPDNAELLWLYYRSFAEAGTSPHVIAVQRLYRAFEIQPQYPPLRMATAYQLLTDGKAAEARAVLRPLAFSVHESAATKRARKIVDAIDEGDLDKALATAEEGAEAGPEDEEPTDGEPNSSQVMRTFGQAGLNAAAN
ncbi:tetratricopeptide repeat protein [Stakelama tenebrarum]|uniref:DUF1570 domain-containing protein n=1 Tax=Stakelama tenebrarum TaxID=2711215 RepID=A0A6G6Y2T8_9SPHN|nr:hypothetical protein [Sphingosinithalassobacter tenebrarum]QIG79264.1 hypothetical protein G5C33_05290 [Sphingosinithalassobacter tenebrarum]